MSVPPFEVHLDLSDRPALVVGGGPAAADTVTQLAERGAAVTVVAPTASAEIASAARHEAVRLVLRDYQRGEVASYRLALCHADDLAVAAQVFRDAEAAGVWLCCPDDPALCSFRVHAEHGP
ncbi:MAG: NAD(P)-dependent oxidoreductase [Actinomycetota bacterium]